MLGKCFCSAGVQYTKAVELPGATMVIQDGNLAIEDSVFSGLSFFGQGALVLSNSNVTFINATFTANNNSAGELWIPLQPTRTFSMAALTFFHMVLTCTVRKQVHFELPL